MSTLKESATEVMQSAVNLAAEDKFGDSVKRFTEITDLLDVVINAYVQRGRSNWEMNRWPAAMHDFTTAEKMIPDNPDIRWTLALMRLQKGDFMGAMEGFESRWDSKKFDSARLNTKKPRWKADGGFKSVLVWSEQGIGDQILYCSMLPALQAITPDVTVMIDARLIPLFKWSMPLIRFVAQTERVKGVESQIPMASLVSEFVRSKGDISKLRGGHGQYLKPVHQNLAGQIREGMKLSRNETIVGISWRSGAPKVGNHKSSSLEEMLPILRLPDKRFVSLQYGDHYNEIYEFEKKHGIHIEIIPEIDNTQDLVGLASLIYACDSVITVSNVTGHLAGALGVKTYLMDSRKLWYWGNTAGNRSLWYPMVKTYPKWSATATWQVPIDDIRREVADPLASLAFTRTFVFYRTGTEEDCWTAKILVKSLLVSNPIARIIMCTTAGTPYIPGTARFEFVPEGDPDDHMLHRLQAFSKLGLMEPAMYLDDDMIVTTELYPPLLLTPGIRAAFCTRFFGKNDVLNHNLKGLDFSDMQGLTMEEAFPFHACCTVTSNHTVWDEILSILQGVSSVRPAYKKWYGDIRAIHLWTDLNPFVALSEEEYGCLPEYVDERSPKIIHFKGNRKELLRNMAL